MKIGISVVSLLPLSYVSLRGAWFMAQSIGMDGLQLIPLVTYTRKTLISIPKDVVFSYEGQWQDQEEGVMSKIFRGDVFAIFGPALFGLGNLLGERLRCMQDTFPQAYKIDMVGGCVEISPANKRWEEAQYLVGDTWHIQELGISQEKVFPYLERHAEKFAPIFHFQTRDWNQLEDFLSRKDNFLAAATRFFLSRSPDVVIIELPPWWVWRDWRLPEKVADRIRGMA